MNLQTYLMIKQANEGISSDTDKGLNTTTKYKYLTGFGLNNDLGPSLHKQIPLVFRGGLLGSAPDGKTFSVDGPPIVINRNTTNNNGVQKIIKSTLGTIGTSGPVRYK